MAFGKWISCVNKLSCWSRILTVPRRDALRCVFTKGQHLKREALCLCSPQNDAETVRVVGMLLLLVGAGQLQKSIHRNDAGHVGHDATIGLTIIRVMSRLRVWDGLAGNPGRPPGKQAANMPGGLARIRSGRIAGAIRGA